LGAPESVVDDVRSAVSEALANAVLHAYVGRAPGIMLVEAWCDADDLIVRVCDEGRGLVPRLDSPGLGVGISLMASMVDDFSVTNRDGTPGTIVSLRFSLAGQSEAA
jgi:anti-sigma regulatory factor (Ser/Thr protein kinase)